MIRYVMLLSALVLATQGGNVLAGGDAAAGKAKAQACVQCHGEAGNSPVTQFPRLAGQYADYIVKALEDYQSGARSNPIMAGFAAPLNETDREDLGAWYASQGDGLRTLKFAE